VGDHEIMPISERVKLDAKMLPVNVEGFPRKASCINFGVGVIFPDPWIDF